MSNILCFGIAREITDETLTSISIEGLLVKDLRDLLLKMYPEFSKLKGFMVAVNQTYADNDQVLHSNDEVAIIPPVSGG